MSGTTREPWWWDDLDPDWGAGDPGRVSDLLATAYPELRAIQYIAVSARIDVRADVEPARQTWVRLLSSASAAKSVLDVMAEVLQDKGSEAFHQPLQMLLGDHLGLVDGRRALKFGLEDPSSARPNPVETMISVASPPGDEPVGRLQALTSLPDGLQDPKKFIQGLLDAMARTAMIEIGGVPRGTGFLVGPDLLLTAAHVIDREHWPPLDQQPNDICARFDYDGDFTRSYAETGTGVPVTEFITASLPTTEEAKGRVVDWNSTPTDRLDFALLRLGFCVPDQVGAQRRGVYALDAAPYNFASGSMLLIVQHPLGRGQQVSFIRAAAQLNTAGNRIKYGGNTQKGSSGSPVINLDGKLVALHHYSESDNRGVPISAIVNMLAANGFRGLFEADGGQLAAVGPQTGHDPFETTSVAGQPFINRVNLRARIRDMAQNSNVSRILTIDGARGSGMTFSYTFASHVALHSKAHAALRRAAPEGLVAIHLDLADYLALDVTERGHRVMCDLLDQLDLLLPGELSAQAAYHASILVRQLRKGLRNSQRQWWIFLDGLNDFATIKSGGYYEIIYALATAANDAQVPMRLVLVGPDASRLAAESNLVAQEDTAQGLTRNEVKAWCKRCAAELGSRINENLLSEKLDKLFPAGGPAPEPRPLAPKLPALLKAVLEVRDGS